MELKVTFDPDANAAYVYLVAIGSGDAVRTEPVEYNGPGGILLDFDRAGQMIGVEILGARELLPRRLLDGAVRLGPYRSTT
jgi:uncharacterized protein YuzE